MDNKDLHQRLLEAMCELADCPTKCGEPFESCTFLSQVDRGIAYLQVYSAYLESKGILERVLNQHINLLLSEIDGNKLPWWEKTKEDD